MEKETPEKDREPREKENIAWVMGGDAALVVDPYRERAGSN